MQVTYSSAVLSGFNQGIVFCLVSDVDITIAVIVSHNILRLQLQSGQSATTLFHFTRTKRHKCFSFFCDLDSLANNTFDRSRPLFLNFSNY